jgi:tetratricopeptide (TPR) repeat protein
MDFRLLGDVEVWWRGEQLPLGGKQRTVLAILLHQANAVVPRSDIIRLAWGDRAGDTPRTVCDLVADYVSRLRIAFRNAGAEDVRLVARGPGYAIEVDEQAVDWHRFRRLVSEARSARDAADTDDAARLLHQALALWRGPALADLGTGSLDPIRTQMEERRLAAAEELAAVEIGRGGADRVVTLLADLAAHQPARERLAALLIRALHATGRRDEAITVYQRTRRHLADQLGLDPTDLLENAYRALLTGQPAAEQQAGAPPAGRPAQLPLDTSNFTGRAAELDALLRLGPAGPQPPDEQQAGVGVICVVDGMAGVGKTALAVHAARRMTARFPDGQLFLDLHGYTDHIAPVEPGEALDRLLRAMGVPGDLIPPHLDDRAALYRNRLAGKRMLILLDNARSADQVRPLLPAVGCLVLVTCRRRLAALDDAWPLSLETLPVADAIALFGRVAGAGRVAGGHDVVERIVELCGRLPLAIRIAAARLRNHPVWTVEHLADRLADACDQLGELDDGERSIAAAFTLSYRDLGGEQQQMFRLLGLVPGRDIDAPAAGALADASAGHAGRLLEELLDAHLLAQEVVGRYRFHDLMRAYAATLASIEDTGSDRRAALARLLDHLLHTAAAAVDTLFPHERHRRPRLPAPAGAIPPVTEPALARAWLDAERANLIAAAGYAVDHGWPAHTRDQEATLWRYLITSAHYAEAVALHGHALRAAREQGDRAGAGVALDHLGSAHRRLGRYEEALQHFAQALAASREVGNRSAEAITLTNLGTTYGLQGRYEDALHHLRRALAIDREVGNHANEANTLSNLGNIYWLYGRYDNSLDHYQRALAIFAGIGDRAGEGAALNNLGLLYERRGRYQVAFEHHQKALSILAEIGDRAGEGTALTNLGAIHRRLGRYDEALDHHHRALAICRAITHRPGEGEALSNIGSTYASLGRRDEALDHYRQALAVARDLGDRILETAVCNALGETLRAGGQPEPALARHRSALALARELGDRYEQARALDGIADALHSTGEHDRARRHWQHALAIYTDLGVPDADQPRAQLADADADAGADAEAEAEAEEPDPAAAG